MAGPGPGPGVGHHANNKQYTEMWRLVNAEEQP